MCVCVCLIFPHIWHQLWLWHFCSCTIYMAFDIASRTERCDILCWHYRERGDRKERNWRKVNILSSLVPPIWQIRKRGSKQGSWDSCTSWLPGQLVWCYPTFDMRQQWHNRYLISREKGRMDKRFEFHEERKQRKDVRKRKLVFFIKHTFGFTSRDGEMYLTYMSQWFLYKDHILSILSPKCRLSQLLTLSEQSRLKSRFKSPHPKEVSNVSNNVFDFSILLLCILTREDGSDIFDRHAQLCMALWRGRDLRMSQGQREKQ